MMRVFLSASVPDPLRHRRYFDTADVFAIRESIQALASIVLPRGQLVFGGHPAISPLVLRIAESLGSPRRVLIFQSEFFKAAVPPESLAFPRIRWTPVVRNDRAASLAMMRRMMLAGRFAAGVFVGGMEGVEEEFALFRQTHPRALALPIGSGGAAAAHLLGSVGLDLPGLTGQDRDALTTDMAYRALFERLLFPRVDE